MTISDIQTEIQQTQLNIQNNNLEWHFATQVCNPVQVGFLKSIIEDMKLSKNPDWDYIQYILKKGTSSPYIQNNWKLLNDWEVNVDEIKKLPIELQQERIDHIFNLIESTCKGPLEKWTTKY